MRICFKLLTVPLFQRSAAASAINAGNHPHPGMRWLCDLLPDGRADLPGKRAHPLLHRSRLPSLLLPQPSWLQSPNLSRWWNYVPRGSRRWPGICARSCCFDGGGGGWGAAATTCSGYSNSSALTIIQLNETVQLAQIFNHRCRHSPLGSVAAQLRCDPLTGPVAWGPAALLRPPPSPRPAWSRIFACARFRISESALHL